MRRLQIGAIDILISMPDQLAQRLRTLGGLLPGPAGESPSAFPAPSPARSSAKREGTPEAQEIQRRVDEHEWYHSIDLGHGIVTPGGFDHRPYLSQYPIPQRLDGMRVLDVGTFDGFWAFEFERRGAAEVVALDIDNLAAADLPPRVRAQMPSEHLARKMGERFQVCKDILGSKVRREVLSVYELSPERVGKFAFVFAGDLLLHLTNPVKALQNICSVTEGQAVIVDVFNPVLPARLISYESGSTNCTWWIMSCGGLEQMVQDAGFRTVELVNKFPVGYRGQAAWMWHAAFRATP